MELFLGGMCFRIEGADFPLPDAYLPFLKPLMTGNRVVNVRVEKKEIPRAYLDSWESGKILVDTASTWALGRTRDPDWPFHFGPSPTNPSDPPVPHVLANSDFSRLHVHLQHQTNRSLYPLDEVLLFHLLNFSQGMVVHASGVEIEGKVYLFLGDSGAGKSTIAEIFEKRFGMDRVYSDDRMILRRHNGSWLAYGSPWHGSLPRSANRSGKIAGLFFLEQTPVHGLDILPRENAIERLMKVAIGPWWLKERIQAHVEMLEDIVQSEEFGVFRLGFAPNDSVVNFLLTHHQHPGSARTLFTKSKESYP